MTVRNGGFRGDYYGNNFDTPSGFDERIPNASEGSNCCFKRKFDDDDETFGVPRMVLPLYDLSSSERKKLVHTFQQELLHIRSFQKNLVDLPRSKNTTIPVCKTLSRAKSFGMSRCSTGPGKRVLPSSAAKPEPVTSSTMLQIKQCETLLKRLMSHQHAWIFETPVDVVKLNIPDYFSIIKHPMDLGTVKNKLTSGTYSSPSEFSADVRLTFRNAMTYNPPGNNVYHMADTLSKFFEMRWKTIEKKPYVSKSEPRNLGAHAHKEVELPEPLAMKRRTDAVNHDNYLEPVKRFMRDEDRVKLGKDLGSLTEFPVRILNFLRGHNSKEGGSEDDEIEIDINDLCDDALFQLRNLFDECLRESQRKDSNEEPCELELIHGSGPGISLMQHCDGSEMEDYDSIRTEKGMALGNSSGSNSLESVPDETKTTRILSSSKAPESMDSEYILGGATSSSPRRELAASVGGFSHLEDASKGNTSFVEGADCHHDGNSAQNEKQLLPEKRYRAALLKNRFADLILKAKEKTFIQNEKRDPEKLLREKEKLELQKKKEKARLQAEAKEAEEACKKAEAQAIAEAAAEAKRKLELEREAARQALVEMEKSVEIDENSMFLKDLELLKTVNTEHLTNMRELGSDCDELGMLGFGGGNPLEQLGLFIKHDEDEDEADPPVLPVSASEVEEGEID